MKITKTRLTEIIKEELESIKEAGDVTDVLITAIQQVPKAANAIKIIQKKNNQQLVANLLVKIHAMVRPDGKISDLFSKAKGSADKMAASQPEEVPPEV
jgi:hypothetical protein